MKERGYIFASIKKGLVDNSVIEHIHHNDLSKNL